MFEIAQYGLLTPSNIFRARIIMSANGNPNGIGNRIDDANRERSISSTQPLTPPDQPWNPKPPRAKRTGKKKKPRTPRQFHPGNPEPPK